MFTNLALGGPANEVFRSVLLNLVHMIAIGDALVSEDVFDELFVCDLSKCKGACCVKGESGAPLAEDELQRIEDVYDVIQPHLRPEALEVIAESGLFVVDTDGDIVTPIINGEECVYATFDDNGTAKCAFEQAYQRGETEWQKPISCHLYPVRLKKHQDFTAVNVHRWDICDGARSCGASANVTVLEFCKSSLVRRFGGEWYDEAVAIWQVWKQMGRSKRPSK